MNEAPSPITQLQGIRVTVEGEARDLLAAADAYESYAQTMDAEAERLRTLAEQARQQEANLRMITAVRGAKPEAAPLCPKCGGAQGYPNSLTHHGAPRPCFCQAVARTTRSPDAVKLCPRCGSPCREGTRARWDDTKRWACVACTWNELDG